MTKNQIEWYAKIILELRLAKGYTQEDLASDAGVNADTIYKIEKGISTGKIKTIERILDCLEYELEIVPQNGQDTAFKR
jgi:transcriptional regulator with XRE-family HTH domain|tara:strand:+ start:1414 stop:1650 length:237 start_codon:yes stop_codon:yes gene_type:complete